MRIDPKLIIEFAAVAEEGSFTRAARRLRVNQPWLSTRVQKLEHILGFQLFERTTRRLSLTERGAQLFEAASTAAKACEAFDQLTSQLSRSSYGVLRIGAAPYTKVIRQRRKLIEEFSVNHPNVHLELETGWSLALLGRLDECEIDLTFMIGHIDRERYEAIELRRFGVAITVSRDHPLAGSQALGADALAPYPVKVFTRSLNPKLWDALHAPLVEAGCQLVETPEMAEGPPGTMESSSIAAAFFDFGADDPGAQDVVRIPLAGPASMPFQLLRRAGPVSQVQDKFWQLALNLSCEPATT
ncbi:LysR family transcriptional regulator [Caulobacter sp. CCNWLY153]|uniref:LysR family transcriptional regulator n=1 Tax=unclassified Caulobacter TaxID=2648921 RepID=UPI002FEFEBDB